MISCFHWFNSCYSLPFLLFDLSIFDNEQGDTCYLLHYMLELLCDVPYPPLSHSIDLFLHLTWRHILSCLTCWCTGSHRSSIACQKSHKLAWLDPRPHRWRTGLEFCHTDSSFSGSCNQMQSIIVNLHSAHHQNLFPSVSTHKHFTTCPPFLLVHMLMHVYKLGLNKYKFRLPKNCCISLVPSPLCLTCSVKRLL